MIPFDGMGRVDEPVVQAGLLVVKLINRGKAVTVTSSRSNSIVNCASTVAPSILVGIMMVGGGHCSASKRPDLSGDRGSAALRLTRP